MKRRKEEYERIHGRVKYKKEIDTGDGMTDRDIGHFVQTFKRKNNLWPERKQFENTQIERKFRDFKNLKTSRNARISENQRKYGKPERSKTSRHSRSFKKH